MKMPSAHNFLIYSSIIMPYTFQPSCVASIRKFFRRKTYIYIQNMPMYNVVNGLSGSSP
jgi:hypothetical protein